MADLDEICKAFSRATDLLFPELDYDARLDLSPTEVLNKLVSILEELKNAKRLTDAAWRKNTYAG